MIYNYVKFSQGTWVTIGIRYNFDEGVGTSLLTLLHVFFLIIQNNNNRKQIKIIVVIIVCLDTFIALIYFDIFQPRILKMYLQALLFIIYIMCILGRCNICFHSWAADTLISLQCILYIIPTYYIFLSHAVS